MNSSTFNSKSEWKVWLVVLAVLLATETTIRSALAHLSQDLVHLQHVPETIERLSNGTGTRILFLGNSITREGIAVDQFEKSLDAIKPVTVEEVYPDDTSITEWLYGYLHFVDMPKKDLDLLLICFAEDQLQDRPTVDVRRLAYNYSDWSTALNAFSEESFSLDQRAEFVLAKLSVSFASAERVQKRILDSIIPYYRVTAKRINNSFAKSAGNSRGNPLESPHYRRLQKLIDAAKSNGTIIMIFAFPVGNEYEIEPHLESWLRERDVLFFDSRNVAGINAKNFPDGYHMDDFASHLMTENVANCVSDWLRTH